MLLGNILRIITSYKFYLLKIIFFEIIYIINGYKGNTFNFSNDKTKADDIPCTYYFLHRIKKILRSYNFNTFMDLGCGSGRIIYFFNKNFPEVKFIGIEFFSRQYENCKKIFKNETNILIKQEDFTKYDFIQHNANCYFFNNPFKNDNDVIPIVEKIVINNSLKENVLFIFVNFDKKIFNSLNKIKCIENYYINKNKGFCIYLLQNKK